jgi:hypothetical protein
MPDRPKDKSSLDVLQKELYSRNAHTTPATHAPTFHTKRYDVAEGWKPEHDETSTVQPAPQPHMFIKRLLTASIAFFVIATALALYVFYGGRNIVSAENVQISVAGPVSIAGGEELALQISVSNNNRTPLEETKLMIEFPEGTRATAGSDDELRRVTESLGTIESGGKETKLVKAVLFGEEGSSKTIRVRVEYGVDGSNAVFVKEQEYDVSVTSAPVVLLIDSPGQTTSGQDLEFTVTAISNSPKTLPDVILEAEYPFGFVFGNADPKPDAGSTVWHLGRLEPQEKRTVTLRGVLSGQDEEDRVFRFTAGTSGTNTPIGTAFITVAEPIAIKRPFIGFALSVNGEKGETVRSGYGEPVRVEVAWANNTKTEVRDLSIAVKLDGPFDERTVVPDKGFYRSSDNTVLWDASTEPSLRVAGPGKSGKVVFSVRPLAASKSSEIKNPEISLAASIKGSRFIEDGAAENLVSSAERKVRISSKINLAARALYTSGPFKNTGPFPPQAEAETTYTIVWALSNASSDLSNVAVAATLPANVRYTGSADPSGEKISFNAATRQVVWNAGAVAAGLGYFRPVREVSFQVGLTPSKNQIGKVPDILGILSATGRDTWTNASLSGEGQALTTTLSTDPGFKIGFDKVVE